MEQINKPNEEIDQKEGGQQEVQVLPRKKAMNPTVQERKKRKKKKSAAPRRNYEVEVIPARKNVPDKTPDAPKKRVAAYCRVSTDEEEQESSFELQVEHYTKSIGAHDDWALAGIYADKGISGTQIKHREQFLKMIEDCKAGKIDMIITKSISRFARNVVDCLSTIRALKALNPPVGIIFEKENLPNQSEYLWKTVIAFDGFVFSTSGRGKEKRGATRFKYTVSKSAGAGGHHYDGASIEGYGNEIMVEGKEKSISRSTVDLALKKAIEMGGRVRGPKALGLPGSGSYLYPMLIRFGVIEAE